MIPRVPFVVIAAASLVAVAAPARADVPPDPDSADAHCSPAEQCPAGVLCDYAFHPGQPEGDWQQVGADCRRDVASKGLERRCRDGGNYGGRELYCPPGATGSWNAPGSKDRGKCAVSEDASGSELVWLIGALWLGRRQRDKRVSA